MNKDYMSWDGTRGPRLCLLSPKNANLAPDWAKYLNVASKAMFARILRCVAALEGADNSLTTPYSFHDSEKVF